MMKVNRRMKIYAVMLALMLFVSMAGKATVMKAATTVRIRSPNTNVVSIKEIYSIKVTVKQP